MFSIITMINACITPLVLMIFNQTIRRGLAKLWGATAEATITKFKKQKSTSNTFFIA